MLYYNAEGRSVSQQSVVWIDAQTDREDTEEDGLKNVEEWYGKDLHDLDQRNGNK